MSASQGHKVDGGFLDLLMETLLAPMTAESGLAPGSSQDADALEQTSFRLPLKTK